MNFLATTVGSNILNETICDSSHTIISEPSLGSSNQHKQMISLDILSLICHVITVLMFLQLLMRLTRSLLLMMTVA